MRSLALTVLLAATLLSCAPRALTPTVSGASVVTLVAPAERRDADGVPVAPGWAEHCDAFAVADQRAPGGVLLLTAAHCPRFVGGLQRYLSPDGVGHGKALRWAEWGGVTALLPLAPGKLRALPTAPAPAQGEPVEAVSSLFEASVRGEQLGPVSPGRYATSLPTRKGWSGAPALDDDGAAWGVVTACEAVPVSGAEGSFRCDGAAIVAVIR